MLFDQLGRWFLLIFQEKTQRQTDSKRRKGRGIFNQKAVKTRDSPVVSADIHNPLEQYSPMGQKKYSTELEPLQSVQTAFTIEGFSHEYEPQVGGLVHDGVSSFTCSLFGFLFMILF